MKSTLLGMMVISAAIFALPACSSQVATDAGSSANAVTGEEVDNNTKSFSGKFAFADRNGDSKFTFTVKKIDWEAKTARWNAKVVENGGSVYDDVDQPIEIEMARCPGCYTFRATENSHELATVVFRDGEATNLTYAGRETTEFEITSVSNAPSADEAEDESSDDELGTCSIICSGSAYACKDYMTKAECKREAFDSLPRCPSTMEFKAGAHCER